MMLHASAQNSDFINKDLLVGAWIRFDPVGGLLTEINSCLWRNKIEEPLFKFTFLEKLDDVVHMRLTNEDYYKAQGQ